MNEAVTVNWKNLASTRLKVEEAYRAAAKRWPYHENPHLKHFRDSCVYCAENDSANAGIHLRHAIEALEFVANEATDAQLERMQHRRIWHPREFTQSERVAGMVSVHGAAAPPPPDLGKFVRALAAKGCTLQINADDALVLQQGNILDQSERELLQRHRAAIVGFIGRPEVIDD